MVASSDLIALCQSQIALLVQSLGAASAIVYLADQSSNRGEPDLIPVAAYPDDGSGWTPAQLSQPLTLKALPEALETGSVSSLPGLDAGAAVGPILSLRLSDADLCSPGDPDHWLQVPEAMPLRERSEPYPTVESTPTTARPEQIMLPLVHEGNVVGLLVTARADRPWSLLEQEQLEQVAHTLAIAHSLDYQNQWWQRRFQQTRRLQAQQSELFHDLLHQFRNPLTALRTFGKLLLKRLQTEDTNRPIATGVVRESDRLTELLHHFDEAVAIGDTDLRGPLYLPPGADEGVDTPPLALDATSLEVSDDMATVTTPLILPAATLGASLCLEPCYATTLMEALIPSAAAVAQERQLALLTNLLPDLPPVAADPHALDEVLSNLVDNALKYTPAGGQLFLQTGLKPLDATHRQGILVADTGPGIPAMDQRQVFQRHYRGIQADSDIPGTGLGLAIAQELAQAMGGVIEVYSPLQTAPIMAHGLFSDETEPVVGTAFILWLPLWGGG